jgi:hypothetical protein
MKLTGENRSTCGKTCPSAPLSTTNPTWTDLESNPGLRGGRPAARAFSKFIRSQKQSKLTFILPLTA